MSTPTRTIPHNALASGSVTERLTRGFYEWEKRGRGWQVWEQPVELEPPFRHFSHSIEPTLSYDDGRRHTVLSRFLQTVGWRAKSIVPQIAACETNPEEPDFIREVAPVLEVQITLPPDMQITKDLAEHFLLNLAYCRGPISFEIVGTEEEIKVQFACIEADSELLKQQLKAHFPESVLATERGYLVRNWAWAEAQHPLIVGFGLSQEFVRPIFTRRNFDPDPIVGLAGSLDALKEGESGVFQVLFQPVRHPWAESILHSVTNAEGKDFFVDSPDMLALAREKISRPLYAVVVRVGASARSPDRAWEIVRGMAGALRQYADPVSNELIPLNNDSYSENSRKTDLLKRQSHRTGMILNSNELVCLVHLPSAAVRCERLSRRLRRTRAAPKTLPKGELLLGDNVHNGQTRAISLTAEQRTKHVYVVGVSGTGKSTFLLNLIAQDIEHGCGIAVLDPHGDLIDDILGRVPERRQQDVVLFDPADEDYPVGFNILHAHSEIEKTLIASDTVAVFRRLSTSWGDQMNTVLSNAVLAFLESDQGGTLADLRRFLVEKEFRHQFLKTVKDRDVVYYWQKEFPLLSGRPQGPILTRLDAFLRPKIIRHMVAQKESKLDFAEIMDSKKIFLAKLAQGAIGEDNAYLLGTFLVSKFHQITLSRQDTHESNRTPFYLYVDEFHNFITPSMASILTSVRKYRLGLVLAHQELRQVERRDSEVASAALSNPYTRVCFRVGEADAKKLAEGFRYFESMDLLNLGTGEAIVRLEQADYDFNVKVPLPKIVENVWATSRRDRIVELSRKRYGMPRQSVEAMLDQHWQMWRETESETVKEKPHHREKASGDPPVLPKPEPVRPQSESAPEPRQRTRPDRAGTVSFVMGKGGQEHKYLQQLIKRWAEGMGYRATIEKQLTDGASVDVFLEKKDVSIACEICVTTAPGHELDNLRKCLSMNATHVAMVSTDPGKLAEVEHLAQGKITADELRRAHFLSPDGLFQLIEQFEAKAASKERTTRGYKVRVKYGTPPAQEKETRRRAVSQVILGALSKIKREK